MNETIDAFTLGMVAGVLLLGAVLTLIQQAKIAQVKRNCKKSLKEANSRWVETGSGGYYRPHLNSKLAQQAGGRRA